jgi:CO/xanthine dehydrogenase Mo-binding subunit
VALIGTAQRRLEGDVKVSGRIRFTADLPMAGLLHGRLILSPHASARIRSIRSDSAAALPGVAGVFSGADLGQIHAPGPDLPLARDRVFYAGQPVVAVVAETEAQAADAAALVEIDYEMLPAAIDMFQAMQEDAPRVLEQLERALDDAGAHGAASGQAADSEKPPNVSAVAAFSQGDVHAALASAPAERIVERRYSLAAVHQGFLETHVSVARPEPEGGFTIWTSTQGGFLTRRTTAEMLGIPVGDVRIVPMPVGGGFGGKICLLEPLVAALAGRLQRPVRLVLDRGEEFLMGRGAPSCVIDLKLALGPDGNLSALWARCYFDNGAGTGGLAGLVGLLMCGTYRVPNYDFAGYDVSTNKTPVGAYRAPGAPHAFFALESAVDELVRRIGEDPIEFRLRHASREGDHRPDGVAWPRIGLVECLESARRHRLLSAPLGDGDGVGLAVGAWGGGREPAAAACRVDSDGFLTLHLGSVDISGTNTTLAMIAAETFGLGLERVRVQSGDTASAPYAGMAGGSKIIYTVGPAVQQAASEARRQLLEIAAEELEASAEDLVIRDGEVGVSGVPGRSVSIGHLAGLANQFGGRYAPVEGLGRVAITQQAPQFTVQIARVRCDQETGGWTITGYAAIQDVGRALNPPEVVGQVHGGTVQALGRVLGEEMRYDPEGQLRTASFVDYMLPSVDQVPEIEVELVEVPSAVGPFGAKGVGEPPAVPGPAAVANAIAAATSVRVTELPVNPALLLKDAAATALTRD